MNCQHDIVDGTEWEHTGALWGGYEGRRVVVLRFDGEFVLYRITYQPPRWSVRNRQISLMVASFLQQYRLFKNREDEGAGTDA